MNYKKIIAMTAVISMLAFSGCSSSKDTAESTDMADTSISAEAAQTEAAPETSAETEAAADETAQTEAPAETEAAPASGISAEEAYSQKNGASWTADLMEKIKVWDKGNIELRCSAKEGDELITSIEMSMFDKKMFTNTEIPGVMTMTMFIDGETCYFLDSKTKSYAIDTENTYDTSSEFSSLVDTESDYSAFSEDGIETIDGVQYIFEKYIQDDSDVIFYFTPDGKLVKTGSDGTVMDFTIDLLEEPDLSRFSVPEDYSEISMEKMAELMMGDIFSAMGDMSDDSSEGDTSDDIGE